MNSLESEIKFLKKLNESEVNVVKEDKFTILTIHMRKCLVLRIILQEDYPKVWPNSVKLHVSETNSLKLTRKSAIDEFIKNTNLQLNSIIDENIGKCCIVQIYNRCKSLLDGDLFLSECFSVIESKTKTFSFEFDERAKKKKEKAQMAATASVLTTDSESEGTVKKSKAVKKASKKLEKEDEEENQSSKFKGSDFIFQRIKWDEKIDKNQVVIGYLDRFVGIKEIKFNDFKGVHEDYKEGVPFHRIRNYKINGTIVWDREQKIDLLTGTGGELTHLFANIKTSDNAVDSVLVEEVKNEAPTTLSREVFVNGDISKFKGNQWYNLEDQIFQTTKQQMPDFIDEFKLTTYNLMSRNNFKKSIISKMNFKKSQAEVQNRSIDDEDEYGLKFLDKIDRMEIINESIRKNNTDFLLLQECDEYEEGRLRENEFIQDNYYICSLERKNNSKIEHPNCVILSKAKPILFKFLKLTDNSNKYALIAKFEFRTKNLKKPEHVLLVNIHLSSNKAKNFHEKRKTQLETLKRYLIDQVDEFDFQSEHTFLCGDFNFGDSVDNSEECDLVHKLFLKNGYKDLVTNAYTFDPESNFSASITAFNTQPRRLDRILYKTANISKNNLEFIGSFLINTAPFKLNLEAGSPILYQPYLALTSFTKSERIKLEETNSGQLKHIINTECLIKDQEFYLHPSDHYGIECNFRFKKSLHESRLVHKSALAIIVPKYASEDFIQQVRKEHDPQVNRWPPHINLLYPFHEDILLDISQDEEASVISNMFECLSRFKPFECDFEKINTFDNNNVVFLEPSKNAKDQMKLIYDALIELFDLDKKTTNVQSKWKKGNLTPHLTICQPVDKRKASKNWLRDTLDEIKNQFKNKISDGKPLASFTVDCVHWIKRTEISPFKIMQSFPLGYRYPSISTGLNITDATTKSDNILKFMHDKELLLSNEKCIQIENECETICKSVMDAIKSLKNNDEVQSTNNVKVSKNSQIRFEFENSSQHYGLITCGSYQHGIKSNDLDLTLLKFNSSVVEDDFSKNMAYVLSQNNDLFHIVRNIGDANVPIIELCLNMEKFICEGSDIQIHALGVKKLEENLFYDNFEFMHSLDLSMNDYGKIFPISGVFENQNLKKYIKNYKDFQLVISFVKYWAKCRCVYGKAFGFLGGISWALMVVYYLQSNLDSFQHELELDNNASRFKSLVTGFFKFYSKFNWSEPISIIDVAFVSEKTNKYQQKSPMMILQTVYPYHNTSKNVNEKARKVIKTEIERAWKLFEHKCNETNFCETGENVCKIIELNDLPEKRIGFKIDFKHRNDLNHIFVLVKAKVQGLITNLQRVNIKTDFRPFTSLLNLESSPNCSYFYIGIYDYSSFNEIENQMIIDYCNNFIRAIKIMSYCSDYDIKLYI